MSSENRIDTAIRCLVFSNLRGHRTFAPSSRRDRRRQFLHAVLMEAKYCNDHSECRPPWDTPWVASPPPFLADSVARRRQLSPALLVASARGGGGTRPGFARRHPPHLHPQPRRCRRRWRSRRGWSLRGRAPDRDAAAALLDGRVRLASRARLARQRHLDAAGPHGAVAVLVRVLHLRVDLFGEVSRRYWKPEEFILGNLKALAWELLVLVPVAVLAWAVWSKRTLETKIEAGRTKITARHADLYSFFVIRYSLPFDRQRHAVSAAQAQRRDAAPGAAAASSRRAAS